MSAADAARIEAREWAGLVPSLGAVCDARPDPGPTEQQVTGFDPRSDLARRAARWGYAMPDVGLAHLARFAAGLAVTEAEAWESDDPIVATGAFEDRRFLLSDRIIHWAVPWADVAGRCHPSIRDHANDIRDRLLELGDRMRPAPLLTGDEGLYPPGEDSYGPTGSIGPTGDHLASLLSGTVVFAATTSSLLGRPHGRRFDPEELADPTLRSDLQDLFETAAGRWRALASSHPGTARLWRDLAMRAGRTAELFSAG